ncbi:MAG: metalloprotease PmbA [Gammaproteobacteria bacterium]|nr:metalloprotease PmbA [Gammaproteobacteria bacterium]
MSESLPVDALDVHAELNALKSLVREILAEAKEFGATSAEVGVSKEIGLSAQVRLGEVETVEFNRDGGFGITVYVGTRKGSSSTSDTSPDAIRAAVRAACDIAKYTAEDPYAGLADAELMATDLPDLELDHPYGLTAEQALERALACESAARSVDARITNSEGAGWSSHRGVRVYGNSHGFVEGYASSRHSLSCVLIGEDGKGMQRDYWYTVSREGDKLESPDAVGRKAAERTLRRLNPRKLKTGSYPVLFSPDIAAGILGHFVNAIRGGNLYRKSSFLLDALGQPVFPDWLSLREMPFIKRGLASAAFDSEGVATREHDLVHEGILESYVLSAYSARKLGLKTTGNAGGVHNLRVSDSGLSQAELLRDMGSGLLVTEVMGQGVNIVTGDYSRGAAGFWVENGEIQYPVEEITIAGNLKDMFLNIAAIGTDRDPRLTVATGSMLLPSMTVAGE